jgi:hypothetical protein
MAAMNRFVFACIVGVAAWAQSEQARMVGTVVDTTGRPVPAASVQVLDARTGQERQAASDERGLFIVNNLAPSTYAVAVRAAGLGPAIHTEIHLSVGQERSLNIVLHPATVTTEITVAGGELTTIDTSSARIGANVNEREVGNLPLNGRQVSQLYLLAPGAQTAGSGSFDNIRFSGRANQQNAIRMDGVEASSIIDASPGNLNGESSTGFRLQSSLEAIQEFRVESSNYPAEYGTGSGGQITVVTKSGGNEFHGSLYEFVRNDVLDARNFFDDSRKSPLRLNQFGASVGGPIRRNRAFFFAGYEGLRQRAAVNLIATVPSAAARARAVAAIAPVVRAFPIGQTPTANPDLDLARLNTSTRMDENYGYLRLDYNFNDRNRLYVRYYRDQGAADSPIESTSVAGSRFLVTAVPQNGLINFSQVLSPTMIHELKLGFNGAKTRAGGFAPPIPGVSNASAVSVDFTGNATIPGIAGQIASAGAARLGGLVRSNSTQNGRGQPYTNASFSLVDSVSMVQGGHNLKFGGEVRPLRVYTDRLGGTTYTFSNLNDLLANRPTQVSFLGDVSAPSPFNGGATGVREASQYYLIGYFQDEWKLRPTLTLSYGLRYEFYSVLREVRGLAVIVDAQTGQFLDPRTTPFYRTSKTNFGPRLGLSWAPARFREKTAFRIGAGYYYGPGQTEDLIQPIESDRVSRTLTGAAAVFPIDPAQIIAGYDINDPTLGFQPRTYETNSYRVPERILTYTASWQQQLPGRAVMTVAYVGSQGRNLFLRGWTNRIIGVNMNRSTGGAIEVRQFGNRLAQMDYKTSGGTDHYDSMQTTISRRFGTGLTFGSQWTWAHSIGNTGGSNEANTTQDPTNFGLDRGNNSFDVRHSVNLSALYELPYGPGQRFGANAKGWMKHALGGWQMGGVWNFRTGLPLEVRVVRPDIVYRDTRNGTYVTSPILVSGVPVTTPGINVPGGGSFRNFRRADYLGGDPFLAAVDGRFFLNPAAFGIPAPGRIGNLGRNALHGPSLSQFDLTLQKAIATGEKRRLEFRAEIYNLLNRTNFANPPAQLNNALGTGVNQLQPGQRFTAASAGSAFGVFNATVEKAVGLGTSRQMQLALRFSF